MNLMVFSFSALLAPVFGLALTRLSDGKTLTLATFHEADIIWAGAIILSFILTLLLRETGHASRSAAPLASMGKTL